MTSRLCCTLSADMTCPLQLVSIGTLNAVAVACRATHPLAVADGYVDQPAGVSGVRITPTVQPE